MHLADIADKKLLGKYYTPMPLAEALASWAVRGKPAKIFDPCFGECALLIASLNVLTKHGIPNAGRFLFGVDIDKEKTANLVHLLNNGAAEENFIISDFLKLRQAMVPKAPFDIIISNPPFVRHHYLTEERLVAAKAAMSEAGLKIPGTAGYWAYFLLHSLSFLKPGGRLVMILPVAFLQADYSRAICQLIEERFDSVKTKVINGRWFEAQEASLILYAEGHQLRANATGDEEPRQTLKTTMEQSEKGPHGRWNVWLSILPSKIAMIYKAICADSRITTLGDWAKIRIGVVTGANHFFIMTRSQKRELGIGDRFTRPIVSRSNFLRGLSFKESDLEQIEEKDHRSRLLLIQMGQDLPSPIRKHLDNGELRGVNKRHKCAVRNPWYMVNNCYAPDAFFHYMSSSVPHVIMNSSAATCTNAIHRLVWKTKLSCAERRAVAVASVTSIAQLSCELMGRSYGGGLLKLEPTRASQIRLPVPPASGWVDQVFMNIDGALRKRDKATAVSMADEVVLKEILSFDDKQVFQIRKATNFIIGYRTKLFSETPLKKA